jgi:hypothetical protein
MTFLLGGSFDPTTIPLVKVFTGFSSGTSLSKPKS